MIAIKSWISLAIAVGLLALGAFGGWRVESWRTGAKIAGLKADVERLTFERDDCSGSLGTQTASVKEWKLKAEEQTKRADDAENAAEKVRIVYRDRIKEIIRDAPQRDAPCSQAVVWVKAQYKGLKP